MIILYSHSKSFFGEKNIRSAVTLQRNFLRNVVGIYSPSILMSHKSRKSTYVYMPSPREDLSSQKKLWCRSIICRKSSCDMICVWNNQQRTKHNYYDYCFMNTSHHQTKLLHLVFFLSIKTILPCKPKRILWAFFSSLSSSTSLVLLQKL